MTEHLRDEVTRLTPEQIKERLAPEMAPRAGERVLGSQLGEMINRALFPHGTYREYRKQGTTARLRTFVEEYADGLVEITADKQGADSF